MDKLKEFRIKKKMTQKGMAEKIGVSVSYYRKIEQEVYDPSYQFMKKMKESFPYVSIDTLFFGKK